MSKKKGRKGKIKVREKRKKETKGELQGRK